MNVTPRFAETFCSQCGKSLGPGDHGTSHCENHYGPERAMRAAKELDQEADGMEAEAFDCNNARDRDDLLELVESRRNRAHRLRERAKAAGTVK